MDNLQQIKAKLEEMKAKYNFERENEDNPNHSDGCGMFYSGFFTCLKEISYFLDTLEVKDVDLDKEIDKWWWGKTWQSYGMMLNPQNVRDFAKHFFELGMQAHTKN